MRRCRHLNSWVGPISAGATSITVPFQLELALELSSCDITAPCRALLFLGDIVMCRISWDIRLRVTATVHRNGINTPRAGSRVVLETRCGFTFVLDAVLQPSAPWSRGPTVERRLDILAASLAVIAVRRSQSLRFDNSFADRETPISEPALTTADLFPLLGPVRSTSGLVEKSTLIYRASRPTPARTYRSPHSWNALKHSHEPAVSLDCGPTGCGKYAAIP